VKNINSGDLGSAQNYLTALGNSVVFAATLNNDTELWASDGTAGGKALVDNINTRFSSNPQFLTYANGYVFFNAMGDTNNGMYRTDGTTAGTSVYVQNASVITAIGGQLYYLSNGIDKTNGITNSLVATIPTGVTFVGSLTQSGSNLFCTAQDSAHGTELWKVTNGALTLVKDINPNTSFGTGLSSRLIYLVDLNGTLLFSAEVYDINGTIADRELYKSDGTTAGTVILKDINPGNTHSSSPKYLTLFNGKVYFTADDGIHGVELWRTDGTATGTILVADINPGGGSSSPQNPMVSGGMLFFTADDGMSGRELWTSDGTAAGTFQIADINPGAGASNPKNLTASGHTLCFTANDGTSGAYLYRYNVPTLVASPSTVYSLTGPTGAQSLEVVSGSVRFTQDAAIDYSNLSITVDPGASISFDGVQHLAALSLNGGGASLDPGHSSTLITNSLTITNGGSIDLSGNGMIVNYSGASPVNAVRGYLQTGRAAPGGAPAMWNGPGIDSSLASVMGNGFNVAIGYVDNAALPGGGNYVSFDGQTIGSNCILIQLTRGADANLDGKVDGQDLAVVGAQFRKPASGQWYLGDFDYSGSCDGMDVSVLGTTYGKSSPTLSGPQVVLGPGTGNASLSEIASSMAATSPAVSVALAQSVPDKSSRVFSETAIDPRAIGANLILDHRGSARARSRRSIMAGIQSPT